MVDCIVLCDYIVHCIVYTGLYILHCICIAVVAERAAMNKAYQGLTPEFGVANMVPPRFC